MSNLIACPNCRHEIAVNDVLQSQLSEQIRAEMEAELAAKHADVAGMRKELVDQRAALKADKESLAAQVKAGIEAQRAKIVSEAQQQAKESLTVELEDRAAQVEELQCKLSAAQHNELELRKKERALESKTEELKLTVTRQLDTERSKIRETALKQFADEHQLKDAEQAKVIADMRRQIDDLKRKAEQGSVQTQGEVQELALESMLETSFPIDTIEPVGKGVNGADCKQLVYCPSGIASGSILWESKRTKNFSKAWLAKLRDDQRTARASIAVLVTQVMPEGVDTFALIDGVWVCSWKCAKGLAMALRAGLIEVSKNKLASEGRVEKMELVYNYLSSQEFQRCVEGIVEAFVTMQTDLESEKRSMKRLWNKREKQIDRAISNTASLYGDLQGIIGASMPAVEGLALPRLAMVAGYESGTPSAA
jgi:hypothetical protein